jgi:hypothetical protein
MSAGVHPGRVGSDREALPDRTKRFPGGAQHRVEIGSVEGPDVLETVLAEAGARGVLCTAGSQGSGGVLLTGGELPAMAAPGAARHADRRRRRIAATLGRSTTTSARPG